MQLKSLGHQTDLLFRRFEGEVIDKGNYLIVRTPKNPGYRWGNCLLFQEPPKAGDLERWKALFAKEIGTPPQSKHFVFIWDGIDGELGEIEPFLKAGFYLEKTVVMTATSVNAPPKLNHECTIRVFGPDDWRVWVELQLTMNKAEPKESQEDDSDGSFSAYLWGKANEYQRMIEAGLGRWFGAFIDDTLASSLGLFVWNGLGRFQMVTTHPAFQRQGLAGTLVYETALRGFHKMGAETLVMCADPDYIALKLYETVGFKAAEKIVGIGWHKKTSL